MALSAHSLASLGGKSVLIIGDVMVDEYLRGEVKRISPEAPVPVLEVRDRESRLGGAANTAANVQALGARSTLIGVVGADNTAQVLGVRLVECGVLPKLTTDPQRATTRKTRILAQSQQIVRLDEESRAPVSGRIAAAMMQDIEKAIDQADVCILSDYAKGVVTPEVAQCALAAARKRGIPLIVDPKQRDFSVYAGATLITPNLHELEAAAGMAVSRLEDIVRAVERLTPALDGAALLVTRSADGMTLFRREGQPFHAPARAKDVYDVTGAGDTVVATLASALAAGMELTLAVELASIAAGIAVSRQGTVAVSIDELRAALG